MRANAGHSRLKPFTRFLAVAGMLAAALMISTPGTEAGDRKGRQHRDHHRVERHVRHHGPHFNQRHHRRHSRHEPVIHYRTQRHHHVVPPRVIRRNMRHSYDPYYWGRVWDTRYRGYVTVYRFPVYTEAGVVYRAYGYHDGRFVARGHFTIGGPVFSVHIDF